MRARLTDPGTSQEHVPTLDRADRKSLIVSMLEARGPMNSKELADATGIDRVSVSPMLKPMEREGLVIRTEEKRDGGILWTTPTGQQELF